MNFSKLIISLFIVIFNYSCNEKTVYSGKIINQDKLSNINYYSKIQLIENLGPPSFFDPIQNTLFYYTEMKKNKNFYNTKTKFSFLFVFKLDSNDQIIEKKAYDLNKVKNTKFISKETENSIIQRGLIEKIFGGVGPSPIP